MKHPRPFTPIIEIPCCQAFFSQHLACVLFSSCFRTDTIPISTAFSYTELTRHRKVLVHSLLFLMFIAAKFLPRSEGDDSPRIMYIISHPLALAVLCIAFVSESLCFLFWIGSFFQHGFLPCACLNNELC
jgi:hypothetical protein